MSTAVASETAIKTQPATSATITAAATRMTRARTAGSMRARI
jgi:hypothetical protein